MQWSGRVCGRVDGLKFDRGEFASVLLGDAQNRRPLALGNGDRVRTILTDAGWDDIRVEAFDGVCDYSLDGSDGVEERLTMILTRCASNCVATVSTVF